MNRKALSIVFWSAFLVMSGENTQARECLDPSSSILPYRRESEDPAPFGAFEVPADNQAVAGDLILAGWVMDDNAGVQVKIYRKQGSSLIYIGEAYVFPELRPDIVQMYPAPEYYGGGWQYHLMTRFLPEGGNGTFDLEAVAFDASGNTTVLGQKKVIADNLSDIHPFGAIDTPVQGGTVKGTAYINWGWALTPQPSKVPTDGSTIDVYVDGVNIGHPNYGLFRSDINALFPDFANSDSSTGYYYMNTTLWPDGLHTIWWQVADDSGYTSVIGSRYFTILNGSKISLLGNTAQIANGDTKPSPTDGTDFGIAVAEIDTLIHEFTIVNIGGDTLLLTGMVGKVTVVGEGFSVAVQPKDTLAPGDSSLFDIRFLATSTGLKPATVSIQSNDVDQNPYTFGIQCTVVATADVGNDILTPSSFSIEQNFPNPFNPSTKLRFSLPKTCYVTLKIYDLLGKEIDTLVHEEKQPGEYTVEWTAKDLPSGIYLYRLQAGDYVETKKMIYQR